MPGLDRGPDDPAYVIFTSGSTGRPKGVAMPHRGLPALAEEIRCSYALGPGDRMLHASSPTFDSGLVEVLSAAVTGAALVVAPVDVRGGEPLARLVREHDVSHVIVTPSVLDTLPVELADRLTRVVLGGEAVPPGLVARWGDRVPVCNAYGPTETRCSINFSRPLRPGAPVTVGPPMVGVTEAVLDRHGRPQPPGAIGVLHASGPQVADGYLGDPEQSAAVFLPSTIGGGPVMYRTGDLASWTADGEVRVLGRRDGQVKLRGLRIELGEIDSALSAHPGVATSATVLGRLPSGAEGLVSYVVPARGDGTRDPLETTDLRASLGARLPSYMIPSAVVLVDALPRTPNDKLDIRALPPVPAGPGRGSRAPRGEREAALCSAVARTLGLDAVDPDAAFPALGGDSLGAVRLVHELALDGWECSAYDGLLAGAGLSTVADSLVRASTPIDPRDPLDELPPERDVPLGPAQRTVSRVPGDPDAQLLMSVWVPEPGSEPRAEDVRAVAGALLARHPVLGATFPDTAAGPVLRAHPDRDVDDLVRLVPHPGPVDLDELRASARALGDALDVRSGPPVAIRALVGAEGDVRAVVSAVHHVAVDGISLSVLGAETTDLLTGRGPGPAPRHRFDRFLGATSRAPAAPPAAPDLPPAAWTLGGVDPPGVTDRRAFRLRLGLDGPEAGRLRERAAAQGITPFTAVRVALAAALAEVTGDRLLASATPVAGRPPGWEDVVGDFVSSALVPLDASLAPRDAAAAERAARAVAEAGVTLEQRLEATGRAPEPGRCFPVPVLVGWAPALAAPGGAPGRLHVVPPERTRWLLRLDVTPCDGGGMRLFLTWAAGGLDRAVVEELGDVLVRGLRLPDGGGS